MKITKYLRKRTLLKKNRVNDAYFVDYKENNRERFKYYKETLRYIGFTKKFQNTKRELNKLLYKFNLLLKKVSWKRGGIDFGAYMVEAIIEGLAINFVLFILFGFKLSPLTVLAYGIGYKQILSFYWKLRKNGKTK